MQSAVPGAALLPQLQLGEILLVGRQHLHECLEGPVIISLLPLSYHLAYGKECATR